VGGGGDLFVFNKSIEGPMALSNDGCKCLFMTNVTGTFVGMSLYKVMEPC
jgi:hypothetical protein